MMAEQEVLREARRVLRHLHDGARLLPGEKNGFCVSGTGKGRHAMKVSSALVQAFAARDWIKGTQKDGYRLSDAGQGFLLRSQSDAPNPFAAQHRAVVKRVIRDGQGQAREVEMNSAESPLAWLKRRKCIDAMQFEAGERLRRDFTLAQLQPRLAVDLTAPVIMGASARPGEMSDMVMAAKQRFSNALKAVGPGLADLLYDVCCHLSGLEGVERRQGWPQRSAKVVLQIALDRLGEHYGLSVRGPQKGTMRNWQMECLAES